MLIGVGGSGKQILNKFSFFYDEIAV